MLRKATGTDYDDEWATIPMGITEVEHDNTLQGAGTDASLLGLHRDNYGTVIHTETFTPVSRLDGTVTGYNTQPGVGVAFGNPPTESERTFTRHGQMVTDTVFVQTGTSGTGSIFVTQSGTPNSKTLMAGGALEIGSTLFPINGATETPDPQELSDRRLAWPDQGRVLTPGTEVTVNFLAPAENILST